jgi:hypothetical protein
MHAHACISRCQPGVQGLNAENIIQKGALLAAVLPKQQLLLLRTAAVQQWQLPAIDETHSTKLLRDFQVTLQDQSVAGLRR